MTADPAQPIPSKPWLTRRRFWMWLTVIIITSLLSALLTAYLLYFRDVPIRISPETTYITEPLTADGTQVDYFAAAEQLIYPPELQTDDNGYRVLVQGRGVQTGGDPELRIQMAEKLGLDPHSLPTLNYQRPDEVIWLFSDAEQTAGRLPEGMDRGDLDEELTARINRPWTFADLPMMEEWLTQNGPILDLMAESVSKPVFHVPWVRSQTDQNLYGMILPEGWFRGYCSGLAARAQFRLAAGDVDGAIDDIVACARLGRHLQHAGTGTECAIGTTCEQLAYGIGAAGSLEHQPTPEQWQRLLDELDRLPKRVDLDRLEESERLAFLDLIQSFATGESRGGDDGEMLRNRRHGLDWNIIMHVANERYDEALRGRVPRPDPSTLEGFMSRGERSRLMGEYLASEYIPSTKHVQDSLARAECKENLQRIAIGLLLYEQEHGTLPPAYSVDDQGQPLQSWRVLLLPYLGHDELYAQVRLDEPWDSAHNRQFHVADVPIFQCSAASSAAGTTSYSVVEGETCAFNGGEGKRLDAFGPNSANLILVIERTAEICWMDPTQEIPFSEACRGVNQSTSGIGSNHRSGGAYAAFRSAAVTLIEDEIEPEQLRGLLEGTADRVP